MNSCGKFDCPICMEDIEPTKNCVHTECGHTFHSSCLMNNIIRNGFGCPYCRTVMATDSNNQNDDINNENQVNQRIHNEQIHNEEYTLRGLRLFFNNLEGLEHDVFDIFEEYEELRELDNAIMLHRPSPNFITQQLILQNVSMEDLVKILLKDHDEYEDEEEEYLDLDDDVFGKMRIIISNYQPSI
jgi:hypothetical protein